MASPCDPDRRSTELGPLNRRPPVGFFPSPAPLARARARPPAAARPGAPARPARPDPAPPARSPAVAEWPRVTDLLLESFDDIFDVKYTARMEEELDEIEEGKLDWREAMSEFYKRFDNDLKHAEEHMTDIKRMEKPTDLTCEKCGKPLVIKWGKHGSFIACTGYPDFSPRSIGSRSGEATEGDRKRAGARPQGHREALRKATGEVSPGGDRMERARRIRDARTPRDSRRSETELRI